MQVIERPWGATFVWGRGGDRATDARDLRKLNAGLSVHHPDFEAFCLRCDRLKAQLAEAVARADALIREYDAAGWNEGRNRAFLEAADRVSATAEAIDCLCVTEYTADAGRLHYSYCV